MPQPVKVLEIHASRFLQLGESADPGQFVRGAWLRKASKESQPSELVHVYWEALSAEVNQEEWLARLQDGHFPWTAHLAYAKCSGDGVAGNAWNSSSEGCSGSAMVYAVRALTV